MAVWMSQSSVISEMFKGGEIINFKWNSIKSLNSNRIEKKKSKEKCKKKLIKKNIKECQIKKQIFLRIFNEIL